MHTAGVFSHIATDGAGNLRRRVGRVIQAILIGSLGDGEIAYTGLYPCDAPFRVDVDDVFEFGEAEQYPLS